MNAVSTMALALVLMLSLGTARAAEPLNFQCQSPELGLMDIKLSNPTQGRLGELQYEVTLGRFDHDGRLLETRRAPDENGKTEEGFFARHYRDESFITFDFPVMHVDWSKHANECWVDGTFAGGAIKFDAQTGNADRSGSLVYYKLQELNPAAIYGWVDHGGPYRDLVPFLNGKECARTSTFKRLNDGLVCRRLN